MKTQAIVVALSLVCPLFIGASYLNAASKEVSGASANPKPATSKRSADPHKSLSDEAETRAADRGIGVEILKWIGVRKLTVNVQPRRQDFQPNKNMTLRRHGSNPSKRPSRFVL